MSLPYKDFMLMEQELQLAAEELELGAGNWYQTIQRLHVILEKKMKTLI